MLSKYIRGFFLISLALFLSLPFATLAATRIQSGQARLEDKESFVENTLQYNVNREQAFIIYSWDTPATTASSQAICAKFSVDNKVRFERYGSADWVNIKYFVFESDAISVQYGETELR